MRLVRIGVASISVKVGDFAGNSRRLREIVEEAGAQGVHLLVTPELALSGYSLEDRVLWRDVSQRSWEALLGLAEQCRNITAFVGLPVCHNAMMYNAAALVHNGSVRGLVLKKFLPTYSIFYEARNWTAWRTGVTEINGVPAGDLVFNLPFGLVSAEICEDLWSGDSPARERVRAGAEIICNSSASPFTPLKNEQRRRLVLGAAQHLACIYAYANLLGCDSSRLVFDGGGFIATPEGVVAEGPVLSPRHWTLTTGVVDLDDVARIRAENTTWRQQASAVDEPLHTETIAVNDASYKPAPLTDFVRQMPESFFIPGPAARWENTQRYLDELFSALVLGLRDYFEKVGAFKRFLVALSGGRDSALCLVLAVYASRMLDGGKGNGNVKNRVWTVYLPHEAFSSSATEDAARSIAEELGVPFRVVAIHEESEVAMQKAAELMGNEEEVTPLARQNLQARVRGGMMLNWSNSASALVLVTSNLSEAAVGYTTTGGDNQGGYSPIANVPKTVVTRLLEHLSKRDGLASLEKVLAIAPSAELAPGQKDEEDLMPYVILDDLLYLFARRRLTLPDCWRVLCQRHPVEDPEQLREWTRDFGRRFILNQWKREQFPVTMKVMDLDLDPKTGFRFPVTQSIEDELEELATAATD
jgi:NAD+ synthase (glutamine-hydrolysing)